MLQRVTLASRRGAPRPPSSTASGRWPGTRPCSAAPGSWPTSSPPRSCSWASRPPSMPSDVSSWRQRCQRVFRVFGPATRGAVRGRAAVGTRRCRAPDHHLRRAVLRLRRRWRHAGSGERYRRTRRRIPVALLLGYNLSVTGHLFHPAYDYIAHDRVRTRVAAVLTPELVHRGPALHRPATRRSCCSGRPRADHLADCEGDSAPSGLGHPRPRLRGPASRIRWA